MNKDKFVFIIGFIVFLTVFSVAESSEKNNIPLPQATLNDIQSSESSKIAINDSQTNNSKTSVSCKCYNSFTGFYIGINAGGSINRSNAYISPSGSFLEASPEQINALKYYVHFRNGGFTVGPQIGYQYQYKLFYCALETDFNYSSLKKDVSVTRVCTLPVVGNITYSVTHKINWLGTLRPKIGFFFKPVAIYATGGLAYSHIQSHTFLYYDVDYGEYNGSLKKVKMGWTVGGGLAYRFVKHWFVDLNYLFIDFGKNSYADISVNFPDYFQTTDLKTKIHNIRMGLNYLF